MAKDKETPEVTETPSTVVVATETPAANVAPVVQENINQNPTPEQQAKDAVSSTVAMFEIDTIVDEAIDMIAKYNNRDMIQMKGDKYWERNKEDLRTEAIVKLVKDKIKALNNYMDKKRKDEAMDYFLQLRARGMSVDEAEEQSGIKQYQNKQ